MGKRVSIIKTGNSCLCWQANFSPHFFKDIKISALALLKMVMHARSGGTLEVMGLILGKVDGNTMFVMDSFALPVEGTETRVNAQAQAYEYMSSYIEAAKMVLTLVCFDGYQSIRVILGWSTRKCYRVVPQSSWIWLLAVWNWCQYSNVEPKLPGTFCCYCYWPCKDYFSWESLPGCF